MSDQNMLSEWQDAQHEIDGLQRSLLAAEKRAKYAEASLLQDQGWKIRADETISDAYTKLEAAEQERDALRKVAAVMRGKFYVCPVCQNKKGLLDGHAPYCAPDCELKRLLEPK